jgi:hypothetical protein
LEGLETDDPARLGYRAPIHPAGPLFSFVLISGLQSPQEGLALLKNGVIQRHQEPPIGFDPGFWIFHTSRNARAYPARSFPQKSPRSSDRGHIFRRETDQDTAAPPVSTRVSFCSTDCVRPAAAGWRLRWLGFRRRLLRRGLRRIRQPAAGIVSRLSSI